MSDELPAATYIGAVCLTVKDLERSIRFYQDQMGMSVLSREDGKAALGAGPETIVRLVENQAAKPKPPHTTGLYHFAVLLPSRLELAQELRRLAVTEAPIEGAADHGVSEAVYLHDPDGTGIEVYSDRPREAWTRNEQGMINMGTDPLDIDGLLDQLEGLSPAWPGMPVGTRMGHVHLQVANLPKAEIFYTGILGFKLMQRYGSAAAFLSAGGYHHHVGINTWAGAGAPPPPADSVGLRYYEVVLPNKEDVLRVANRVKEASIPVEEREGGWFLRDPSQNGILLKGGLA